MKILLGLRGVVSQKLIDVSEVITAMRLSFMYGISFFKVNKDTYEMSVSFYDTITHGAISISMHAIQYLQLKRRL
jgi:hypothetical protein